MYSVRNILTAKIFLIYGIRLVHVNVTGSYMYKGQLYENPCPLIHLHGTESGIYSDQSEGLRRPF